MSSHRKNRVEAIRRQLLKGGLPRFQMSLILLLTGLAGFLTSFSLLHLGIGQMWLRYPVAIFAAYCVFLLLLRVWLWLQDNRRSEMDLPGMDLDLSAGAENAVTSNFSGGGDFGGGGAGGSWGDGVSAASVSNNASISDSLSFDLDLEEIGLVILAVAALIGGILAAFYVIYIAPILLAEIFVDGVLLAGLYKKTKDLEKTNWLKTAVKKTLMPAILAFLLFTIAGFTMQKITPEARSIGEVYKAVTRE